VEGLAFGRDSIAHIPAHRQVRVGVYVVTLLLHAVLLVVLFVVGRSGPVRVAPGGSSYIGIAAFNPGPVGTAGTAESPVATPQPAKKVSTSRASRSEPTSKDEPADAGQSGGSAGSSGAAGSGPVRLGTGEGLTLLTKITPTYPRVMEAARIPGTVVLDAIIHRDGTIGDVTILRSTNDAFAQAAVDAIKRWRYTSLPYEGVVTVTVNFTPR
jgi:TonB family protein